MSKQDFQTGKEFAETLDKQDLLSYFREKFFIPKMSSGEDCTYLVGNSLGLQPKTAQQYVDQEFKKWALLGGLGHLEGENPWFSYHELLTEPMARLVGAKPSEIIVMNTLTVNLHLMMVSFYRPQQERFKVVLESGAFSSDQYAVDSQIRFHGFDPRVGRVEVFSKDILDFIEQQGSSIALILLGNVNFRTGQAFDMAAITKAAHSKGCLIGWDLAHGVGNLELKLHDSGADFAVWCHYKYLNAGPGALGGCFVHERHLKKQDLLRFEGWWGHNKKTRFTFPSYFDPIPTAEAWQLSNLPIFSVAPLRASLEIFDQATMSALRKKSELLTSYLEFLLSRNPSVQQLTPKEIQNRGAQLSFRVLGDTQARVKKLKEQGFICDFRAPDILRLAPVPLYNTFMDVYRFSQAFDLSE